jgi:hypothetical protein
MKTVVCILFVLGIVVGEPRVASAQGGEVDAASAAAPTSAVAPTAPTEAAPRAPRGPAVRERGGRRSRGGSAASGALMITVLVGFVAYYVIKRLRR